MKMTLGHQMAVHSDRCEQKLDTSDEGISVINCHLNEFNVNSRFDLFQKPNGLGTDGGQKWRG